VNGATGSSKTFVTAGKGILKAMDREIQLGPDFQRRIAFVEERERFGHALERE
jgi:hypothetical protein